MKSHSEVISSVNHLLEILNERTAGYRKASENVNDSELKVLFEKYAEQAESFEKELLPFSDEISAKDLGTRKVGDAWRVWMDIKSAITQGGRVGMLNACITGESAAIRNYKKAFDEDLPRDLKDILRRQLAEIENAQKTLEQRKAMF
ncbi:MAG TPA: PA2169 family four-helix-bundle protein [Cytophagaceae bacterium]